jgi:hypothetical protein
MYILGVVEVDRRNRFVSADAARRVMREKTWGQVETDSFVVPFAAPRGTVSTFEGLIGLRPGSLSTPTQYDSTASSSIGDEPCQC